ncbi:hypothetical protein EG68_09286 [Paragonimus skrjabini miyazakii]|uniref:nicotinamidase n=1 Tax=Paragonimus skrjabini miyazakii TaxID=59628 RepID=A0A8S9YI47_9TREM|nr:hypothetical protein EG68_09286 [Paragonimus skrjabini miyazakii]
MFTIIALEAMPTICQLINCTGIKSKAIHLQQALKDLGKSIPSLRVLVSDMLNKLQQNDENEQLLLFRECFSSSQNTALLIIDFQHDFVCGTLRSDKCPAKQSALRIVHKINALLDCRFAQIYTSYDWHPENHCSFYINRKQLKLSIKNKIINPEDAKIGDVLTIIGPQGVESEQKLWPVHCVANTQGSNIYPGLKLPDSSIPVYKGTLPDVESYSVFGDPNGVEDTGLKYSLKTSGIRTLVLCGIAFDVCVAASALDATKLGYRVIVIEDACVGIDHGEIQRKRQEMLEAGVHLTYVAKIHSILSGEFAPLFHVIETIKQNRAQLIDCTIP